MKKVTLVERESLEAKFYKSINACSKECHVTAATIENYMSSSKYIGLHGPKWYKARDGKEYAFIDYTPKTIQIRDKCYYKLDNETVNCIKDFAEQTGQWNDWMKFESLKTCKLQGMNRDRRVKELIKDMLDYKYVKHEFSPEEEDKRLIHTEKVLSGVRYGIESKEFWDENGRV